MANRSFEEDAFEILIMLRDGAWGDSVAERQHGFKMLLELIRMRPITRKHSQLISMIESSSVWLGRDNKVKVATTVGHIRGHMPQGLRVDKKSFHLGDWKDSA